MDKSDWPDSVKHFIPDPEHVNALPMPLRQYIHDLETRCNPAGDVPPIACLRENVQALTVMIDSTRNELQEVCTVWRGRHNST